MAETLGRYVWEIERDMPAAELTEWVAYFKIKNENQEKAYKAAAEESKRKGRR